MVEVTAAENNKGAAVTRVLEQNNNYGAILCAGDDLTDESMFELNIPRLLTIKVGPWPTQARFRVTDPATFRKLLDDLFKPRIDANRPRIRLSFLRDHWCLFAVNQSSVLFAVFSWSCGAEKIFAKKRDLESN